VTLRHGGDLGRARAAFGEPEGGWRDLSTGVNPEPWPVPPLSPEALTRLPSGEMLAALAEAARQCFGAARALPTPGAQAAIRHLPWCLPAGDVAVVSPTYGEHAPAWEAAGHRVRRVAAPEPARVLVVTNPNNPDGRCWRPEALLAVECGLLAVDESFVDPTPELSLAGYEHVVVLRSFGKFYGLPGLRLGFALGPAGLLEQLDRRLGPWAVSGPALEIGARAYRDAAWAARTRRRLPEAALRLDRALAARGFDILGGTPLFRFIAGEGGLARFARQGLWVRDFPELPGCLRLGLPPDETAWARLARV